MAIFHPAWPTDELPHRTVRARPARRAQRPRRGVEAGPAVQPAIQPAILAAAGSEAARTMMWSLEADGWTEREAGNLVGLLHGLRPARAGWSEREIEHLRFLRALVDAGRLDH